MATTITGTTIDVGPNKLVSDSSGNVTASGVLSDPSGNVRAGRKNLVLNGSMQVNQRGATSGITSGYFVDRFTLSSCSASAVLTSSTPTEFPTAISVSATSGNPIIFQKIESKNCQGLSGKTVTVSFYAKNISNATTLYVKLQYAGSADSWGSSTTISEQNLGSLTSGWVKYTASWTVPAGGLNGLSLGILCAGAGTFTMGVTGVQMEVGSVATDFEHRSYGEILADCQRYFSRQTNLWSDTGGTSGHRFAPRIFYPVTMRSVATVTLSSITTSNMTSPNPNAMSTDGVVLWANLTTTTVDGSFTVGLLTADAEL